MAWGTFPQLKSHSPNCLFLLFGGERFHGAEILQGHSIRIHEHHSSSTTLGVPERVLTVAISGNSSRSGISRNSTTGTHRSGRGSSKSSRAIAIAVVAVVAIVVINSCSLGREVRNLDLVPHQKLLKAFNP